MITSKFYLILQLFFITISFSCVDNLMVKSLSESDKLVIEFMEQNKIVRTVITEDKNAIKKLVYALNNAEAKNTGCELSGKMIFYKNKTALQQVEFSIIRDCRYFKYRFENNQVFSSITNETANFLQSVKEGLDYY
ncbi:MAG: hypothetical protein H0V91_11425 [Flavisolibacter sp.]|nr:hypothetical protein [Flavisolibacter sp.]